MSMYLDKKDFLLVGIFCENFEAPGRIRTFRSDPLESYVSCVKWNELFRFSHKFV